MQKTVAALVAALLVASLAGCAPEELPAPTPPVAPATVPAAPGTTYATDRSFNTADFEPVAFPSFDTTETPAVLADKLAAGRAMLILFYDSRQDVTGDLRVEVDYVINEYRGLIDLVTFDVGKVDDQGAPAFESVAAVMYAGELSVTSTPHLIAVDRGGFITWRWRGFVDRGYIKREVERATD
jgi:hypothetical protein